MDDQELKVHIDTLVQDGHKVDKIKTPEDALEAVTNNQYDLIILELSFNEHNNGFGKTEELVENKKNLIKRLIEKLRNYVGETKEYVEEEVLHHYEGLSLLRYIKQESINKDTPVVLCSKHEIKDWKEKGAIDYLKKPLSPIQLDFEVKYLIKNGNGSH